MAKTYPNITMDKNIKENLEYFDTTISNLSGKEFSVVNATTVIPVSGLTRYMCVGLTANIDITLPSVDAANDGLTYKVVNDISNNLFTVTIKRTDTLDKIRGVASDLVLKSGESISLTYVHNGADFKYSS